MQPETDVPAGLSVSGVLWLVAAHPWQYVARRWNYKSAALSSLFRAGLFFSVNLSAGLDAALAAMAAEFAFRFVTAGFYGALTQAFRRAEPERAATLAVMVLLPIAGHSLELALHWSRGTPRLAESILASVALTPQAVASYDAVVLTTDHAKFDYEMVRTHAQVIIDSRGVYRTAADNIVKA